MEADHGRKKNLEGSDAQAPSILNAREPRGRGKEASGWGVVLGRGLEEGRPGPLPGPIFFAALCHVMGETCISDGCIMKCQQCNWKFITRYKYEPGPSERCSESWLFTSTRFAVYPSYAVHMQEDLYCFLIGWQNSWPAIDNSKMPVSLRYAVPLTARHEQKKFVTKSFKMQKRQKDSSDLGSLTALTLPYPQPRRSDPTPSHSSSEHSECWSIRALRNDVVSRNS
jgi:hypothetical protein